MDVHLRVPSLSSVLSTTPPVKREPCGRQGVQVLGSGFKASWAGLKEQPEEKEGEEMSFLFAYGYEL